MGKKQLKTKVASEKDISLGLEKYNDKNHSEGRERLCQLINKCTG